MEEQWARNEGRAASLSPLARYLSGESRFKDVDSLGDGILELRTGT
jgi:hypothetical protein